MADPIETGPSVPGQAGVAPFEAQRPFDPLNDGNTIDARQLADHEARKRRTGKQAWTDAINNSAAAKMVRNIGQRVDPEADILTQLGQGAAAITGQAGKWGDENWDKQAHFDELTKDLPVEYWEDLFDQDSLEGAKITRGNILEEQRRLRRIGLDKGAAAVFSMAGSLIDIDLPLTVLTGGAFLSAKTSGKAMYMSARAGLSGSVATRVAGVAGGMSAGLQAGAIVGAGDALNSDVTNWMDGVVMALTTAGMGGAIGAAAPNMMLPMREVKDDFVRRVREGDPAIWDDQRVMATDNVPGNIVGNPDDINVSDAMDWVDDTGIPSSTGTGIATTRQVDPSLGLDYPRLRAGTGLKGDKAEMRTGATAKQAEWVQKQLEGYGIVGVEGGSGTPTDGLKGAYVPDTRQLTAELNNKTKLSEAQGIVAHEAIHAMRFTNQFTAQQWRVLSQIEFKGIMGRLRKKLYDKFYERQGIQGNWKEDGLKQEEVAYAFQEYVSGGATRKSFDKVARKFNMVDPEAVYAVFQDLRKAFPDEANRVVDVTPSEKPDVPAFVPPNAANDLGAAAMQGPSPSPFPALKDPIGNMSDRTKQWIIASRNYIWSTGFDIKRKVALGDWFTRVSSHPLLNPGTNNVTRLWKSQSSIANRLAAVFFEIPAGTVRGEVANAPVLRDMYNGRMSSHVIGVSAFRNSWARRAGLPMVRINGKGYGASRKAQIEFNRAVILDMNAVALGRPRNPDADVRAASDMYGASTREGLEVMRGRPGEIPMDGADKIAPDTHFMPYRANGNKMAKLLTDGIATREDLVAAYAEGYLRAGQIKSKDVAEAVAKAYVDRFVGRATKLDDSMISVFSKDGREFLEMALRSNKLTEKEIANIMKRFDADLDERGKVSTLKHRNDLDLETPIGNTGLVLADMMRTDLDSVYAGYFREVSGAAALARHGMPSRASRKEIVEALLAEQRALGEEPMSGELLEAMFSEYDGGPQWGVHPVTGGTDKGIGIVSEAKALTSLATLTFNGFAQLAETGVGFITVGARNWYGRGIGRLVSNAIKTSNREALNELAYFMGRIGQDQHTLKAHLNLDESTEYFQGNSTGRAFLNRAREFISHANYLQGYTSLLNHVRGYQQEIGVLGMMDKISRIVREGGRDQFEVGGRIHRDTGLDPDHFDQIKALIDNGTIQFKTENTAVGPITYVDRLNLDKWDERMAQDFAAALNRSMNQIVQKAMIGETDRWMHTTWGSMLSHLQTFPILAVQKQFMRNAASRDGQAVALALSAYATSYAAIALRDALTGKERDSGELARAAFGYSNITGWMPMYTDPLMSILGLPDLRVNQFGPYAKPLSVPALDVMNKLIQAPGAVARTISDTETYHDRASVRAIPFVRLIESAVRMGSFGNIDLIEPPKSLTTEQIGIVERKEATTKDTAREQLFGSDKSTTVKDRVFGVSDENVAALKAGGFLE